MLFRVADRRVGGQQTVLVIDDTALLEQGSHSVGVIRRYCGALGKRANCQVLVSLTLARGEVPVPIGLRLYLPEDWALDARRRAQAKVPESVHWQTKGQIALAQLDAARAAGVRFGAVLADAGYGCSAAFRAALSARGLRWAVGVPSIREVFALDVSVAPPTKGATGRPQKHLVPSEPSRSAEAVIDALGPRALRRVAWRTGSQGRALSAEFAAVRIRVADGAQDAHAQHLPGEQAWLVCERRTLGERKYYKSSWQRAVGGHRAAAAQASATPQRRTPISG